MRWDWTDARYFLAVAESGTTLGAARALGVNQTTCARRIAALEAALGLSVFYRAACGYALPPAGEAGGAPARGLAEAAAQFDSSAQAARRTGLRTIRLTTSDALGDTMAAPAIAAFRAHHPELVIELDITDRLVDIVAGEADIALRGSLIAGNDPGLIQKRLPDMRWGFYCSTAYADANGVPGDPQALASHPLATLGGAVVEAVRRDAPHAKIVDVTNSIGALGAVLRAGYCVGLLPCMTGDADPGLKRCFVMDTAAPLWLVYAERLRGRAEARAFLDFILDHVERLRPQLQGEV